jgi:hypothetical protein
MSVVRVDLDHVVSEERQKRERQHKAGPWVIVVIAVAAAIANWSPEGMVNPPSTLVPPLGTQGWWNLLTPVAGCNELVVSGGNAAETRVVNLGKSSGEFLLSYEMVNIHDRIVVKYEGRPLFDTGCVSGASSRTIGYAGTDTYVTVEVTPNCAGSPNPTVWNFTVGCPQ